MPVPAARRRGPRQRELALEEKTTSNTLVNAIRIEVDQWRELADRASGVSRRRHNVFCCTGAIPIASASNSSVSCEAIETLIWLTEVAPKKFSEDITNANAEANPGLYRLACKMATGAGKTTVMAMIIAWQAVNKARRPDSKKFSDAFLDRHARHHDSRPPASFNPGDPSNTYEYFDLVPSDLMDAVRRARIVITNYHAFMLRETEQVSKLNRQILGGREGEKSFTETEGEMIARVAPELMGRRTSSFSMTRRIIAIDIGWATRMRKPDGRGSGGGQEKRRGGTRMDQRNRGI